MGLNHIHIPMEGETLASRTPEFGSVGLRNFVASLVASFVGRNCPADSAVDKARDKARDKEGGLLLNPAP